VRQVPLSHTPPEVDVLQFEPAATHFPPTQQPSPAHVLPSQQPSPGAPQALHALPLHPRPAPVQKLAVDRELLPWQQLWPSPPHAPQPPSALAEQFPVSVPPQAAPGATHLSPAQHAPLAHALSPQHAWPIPPQAWKMPNAQTVAGLDPEAPGAMHRCVVGSWHAPYEQAVAPGQGGVPATPQ
jgi:hypothetical protein